MSVVRPTPPAASRVTILALPTDSVGTNWVTYADVPCYALDIINTTGTAIQYRRGGAGNSVIVADGASRLVLGIKNANEISLRRTDVSNTVVNVAAEAFS